MTLVNILTRDSAIAFSRCNRPSWRLFSSFVLSLCVCAFAASIRASDPDWTQTTGSLTATVNQTITYSFTAHDPDADLTQMEIAWRTPSGAVYAIYPWFDVTQSDQQTVDQAVAFNQGAGTYELWVNARDSNGGTRDPWAQSIPEERITITVSSGGGNIPPSVSISPMGTQTIALGQSITYSSIAMDDGNMTAHNFDWKDPDGNWAWLGGTGLGTNGVSRESSFPATTSSNRSITATPTRTGTFRIRWGAQDPAGWTYSGEYNLVVTGANSQPTCTVSASATTIQAGQTVVISVAGNDVNGNLRYINVDQLSPINGYYGPGDTGTSTPPNNGPYDLGANYYTRTRNLTLTLSNAGTYVFRGAVNDGTGWNYSPTNVTVTVISNGTGWTNIYTSNGYIYSNEELDEYGNGTGVYASTTDSHGINVPSAGTIRAYTTGSTDTGGGLFAPNWGWLASASSGGDYSNFSMTVHVGPGLHHLQVGGEDGYTSGYYDVYVEHSPDSAPPAAPTANPATNIGSTEFTANWTSVAGGTGYRLDVSATSNFTTFVAGFNNRDVGGVTSYAVTSLAMGTTYYYRVRTTNAGGASTDSATISATTTVTAPGAPAAGSASAISGASFDANWSAVPGAAGYRLDVATNSGFSAWVPGFQNREVGMSTGYAVTGLATNNTYYYRIRAYNSAGTSISSNVTSVTTVDGPINGSGPGLYGTYYHGLTFDYPVSVAGENIAHYWGSGGPGVGDPWYDPDTGDSGEDNFAVRWTGRVQPRFSGMYTFSTYTDDGVRLWVDGNLVIDHWYDQSAEHYSAPISLAAGVVYNIQMEFYENGGDANAVLFWQSASEPRAVIPTQQLYLPGAQMPAVSSTSTNAPTGQPWSPASIPGGAGYIGGAGTGRWEFVVVDYTNWGSVPWTPPASGTYTFYVMKRGDANYEQALAGPYTLTANVAYPPPNTTAATNVTSSSFTANWNSAQSAWSYSVDVSTNPEFSTYVAGYQNTSVSVTSLSVSGLAASTTYYYRVRAQYGLGSPSGNSATVQVTTLAASSAPTITANPVSQTVATGTSVSFSVSATGSQLSYQWRRNGVALANGGTLAGATAATLRACAKIKYVE